MGTGKGSSGFVLLYFGEVANGVGANGVGACGVGANGVGACGVEANGVGAYGVEANGVGACGASFIGGVNENFCIFSFVNIYSSN
jgi:hypothetical protein